MKFVDEINNRLSEMAKYDDPDDFYWPEKCGGSRDALVVFIGPSPGGVKEERRRERKMNCVKPLWNKPYFEPLTWSNGFKQSFQPIVQIILGKEYETAAKIIAVMNMDWMQNPESEDVGLSYMRIGCSHILPVISDCDPKLIIPMDKKTFRILQEALILDGFDIDPVVQGEIRIKIWESGNRSSYHREIMAFQANKGHSSYVVIKSFQHPARIFNTQYALRVGQAIKLAANQIWTNSSVRLNFD